MAIPVSCPSCGFDGDAPDETAGKTVLCPDCRFNIPVPDPNAKRAAERIRTEAPPERAPVRRDDDDDDDDDLDERPSRRSSRRRRSASGFTCPNCGSSAPPVRKSQISSAGWTVLVLMLCLFWPLFWIGLLMKEEFSVCADCGKRL